MNKFCTYLYFILFMTLVMPAVPILAAEEAPPPAPAADAGKKDEPKDGEKKAEGDEKSKKDGPKDVSGGRFAGDPVYVHLSPMVIPIITDDGAEQIVTFLIDIEVKDFDVADHIHTIMPRVMDSLLRSLYGGLGQGSLRRGKLVDVSKIKAKAISAISEVVGADGIRDVLVQGVAQRML